MRKLLIILLAFAIILLSGCNNSTKKAEGTKEPTPDKQQTVENTETDKESKPEGTESEKPVSSDNQTTEKPTDDKPKQEPVLPKPVTPVTPTVPEQDTKPEPEPEPEPEQPKTIYTPFGEFTEEIDCIAMPSYGKVVDWFVEGDVFYATFRRNDRFIALNTSTGEVIYQKSFSSRPAEIHAYGDELWISFPKLKKIEIYNKNNYSLKKTLSFEHEISSFDIYGDYLFYAEDDQHVNAFRYNLKTNELVCINSTIPGFGYFYMADILVDQQNKSVIIANSFITTTDAYCFDIETLKLKSTFNGRDFDGYNSRRQSFIYDGVFYWYGMQFNPTDISTPIGQYEGSCITWVDEYFACTNTGVFLRESYIKILPAVNGAAYTACATSESGNLIAINDNTIFVFPA